ncbi:MAG: GNAT family N-acetyltransferase [Thermoplasmata archaeon]|nr:GNAT family N-acetyltransferase [Thermoplasmata archaeon]
MPRAARPETEVRRLRAEEWEAFRRLRLQALESDPLAFGSTHSRELSYSEEYWNEWAGRSATGDSEAIFVAVDPTGQFVGMVGIFSKESWANLWGMWVRPRARNGRVGTRLLAAAVDWAELHLPSEPVRLEVNPSQEPALRLYERAGFRLTGVQHPLGHQPPAVVREMTLDRKTGHRSPE